MTTQEALTYFKHRIECGQCGKETTQMSAFEEAIKALEKQIPEKPIPIDDGWRYWDCPNCGLRVGSNMDFKYWTCMCGQRIDWSDTE